MTLLPLTLQIPATSLNRHDRFGGVELSTNVKERRVHERHPALIDLQGAE